MSREQVVDKISDDRVRLVAELRDDATNQRVAAAVPLEIDRAMRIAVAVNFCSTVRTSGLFRPDLDKTELFLELRVAHDLTAQRPAAGRDHLDHGLHLCVTLSKSD